MKYFSMFSGIGGFELGFPKEWECAGFSEIDKYAIKVYEHHFPNHRNYGDARTIKELPDFDLLCGGFPCQSFSIAGKRTGMSDTRGTLFFEICRIIRIKKPEILLLENVQGLLSADKRQAFTIILNSLAELGYDVQWQVLNGDQWLPQNRSRTFIIGTIGTESRPQIFPLGKDFSIGDEIQPEKDRQRTRVSCLNSRYGQRWVEETYIKQNPPQAYRIIYNSDKAVTLQANAGGCGAKTGLYQTESGIRRLTPLECERIMGFPDNWTEGISDTQRIKCLGNAVMPPVIKTISKEIK